MSSFTRPFWVATAVVLLVACGGGGGGSVAPTPDYSLSVAPTTLKVRPGISRTVQVEALRTAGHSGAITLSLVGPPPGVTGAGSIATGSSTGTLTISIAADATPQTTTLSVSGNSGALTHTAPNGVGLHVVPVGAGENRITSFTVSGATHALVVIGTLTGDIAESTSSGTLSAILPGGADRSVTLTWTTDGGTVQADGAAIASPAVVDLATITQLVVVDEAGNEWPYALQVGDTGLPSVFVRTTGAAPIDSLDVYVTGDVTILGGSAPYAHDLPTRGMKIKGRGHSTWDQPKKPYRFTLDASVSVLGLSPAKNWVLLANHFDMSLMRNTVAFEAARSLSGLAFSPTALPVDLYVNGGYAGTYAVTQQIEIGNGRIPVAAPGAAADTSYFIEANSRSAAEGGIAGVDYFVTAGGQVFDYKSPKASSITVEQKAFIQAMVQGIEDGVPTGVPADVDVDSFVDWLIVEEVFKNQDSMFLSSVNLYRDAGQTLRLGPVWDFDLAAGNSNYGDIGGFQLNDWHGWFPKYAPWYDGLFRQLAFSTAFKARWNEVRDPLKATIMASIDRQSVLLARSQKQNFDRWPVLGVGTWATPPELIAADTWEQQVDFLRAWIDHRFQWMDEELNRLYPW